MKKILFTLLAAFLYVAADAQTNAPRKVYDENINPLEQIDQAVAKAEAEGKYVICQVGGNWCPWCLRFAEFITTDADISTFVDEHFVYAHVNYNPRKSGGEEKARQAAALMKRLDNCGRFGYPVFVVLDEEGQGYNKEKVLRFFKAWTPQAVKR